MSENLRNQPHEGYGSPGRSSNENYERSRYEEFGGMNYEQRRPAYCPRQTSTDTNDTNSEKRERPDEL